MRSYPNIEPSGFHRGQYGGYADGVWRIIRREQAGGWVARHTVDTSRGFIFARTLAGMSDKLGKLAG